ncbi:MAG: hypothetical protein WAL34_14785, partial [Acidobacteriaceae bacterium]
MRDRHASGWARGDVEGALFPIWIGRWDDSTSAVAPFVWTGFSVFKRKNCSASRRRGGGNVKIGFIDFQGLVGR